MCSISKTMAGSSSTKSVEKKYAYRVNKNKSLIKNKVRVPGVEPGSTAWKAAMLTATPHTLQLPSKVTRYSSQGIHTIWAHLCRSNRGPIIAQWLKNSIQIQIFRKENTQKCLSTNWVVYGRATCVKCDCQNVTVHPFRNLSTTMQWANKTWNILFCIIYRAI